MPANDQANEVFTFTGIVPSTYAGDQQSNALTVKDYDSCTFEVQTLLVITDTVTFTLEDSADGVTYATVSSYTEAITATPSLKRIYVEARDVRPYVRVTKTGSGSWTGSVLIVAKNRHNGKGTAQAKAIDTRTL